MAEQNGFFIGGVGVEPLHLGRQAGVSECLHDGGETLGALGVPVGSLVVDAGFRGDQGGLRYMGILAWFETAGLINCEFAASDSGMRSSNT